MRLGQSQEDCRLVEAVGGVKKLRPVLRTVDVVFPLLLRKVDSVLPLE